MSNPISTEVIAAKILLIRGKRVMLDRNLAKLYEVDTRQLTRQVKRNMDRFPEDFMFQLTKKEAKNLMCQIGTSSWGGARKLPYAFTEQGVAMLSSGHKTAPGASAGKREEDNRVPSGLKVPVLQIVNNSGFIFSRAVTLAGALGWLI